MYMYMYVNMGKYESIVVTNVYCVFPSLFLSLYNDENGLDHIVAVYIMKSYQ